MNEIAAAYEIAPNQLRNWKSEFLENAEIVFDRKRDNRLRDELNAKQREADQLAKKVGQQAIKIDFKKNVRDEITLDRRAELLRSVNAGSMRILPVSKAAVLLSVSCSALYYKPSEPSEAEVAAKNLIDTLHTDHPAWGYYRDSSKPRG